MSGEPWTHRELEQLIPAMHGKSAGDEFANAPPLPALTVGECQKYLHRLLDYARVRPLTPHEIFLHAQLLGAFEMALTAKAGVQP